MSKGPWRKSQALLPSAIATIRKVMVERKMTTEQLAAKSRLHKETIRGAFRNSLSRFHSIEAMATALGLELVVREKSK